MAGKKKQRRSERAPAVRRMKTKASVNDLVIPIILAVGLLVGVAGELESPGGDPSVTWPLVAAVGLVELALLAYIATWCWTRSRGAAGMDVELGPEAVYLPPSGLRLRGRTVPYREITSVEVKGPGSGRRITIRFHGGSRSYGRDAIVDQLHHLQRALLQRVHGG